MKRVVIFGHNMLSQILRKVFLLFFIAVLLFWSTDGILAQQKNDREHNTLNDVGYMKNHAWWEDLGNYRIYQSRKYQVSSRYERVRRPMLRFEDVADICALTIPKASGQDQYTHPCFYPSLTNLDIFTTADIVSLYDAGNSERRKIGYFPYSHYYESHRVSVGGASRHQYVFVTKYRYLHYDFELKKDHPWTWSSAGNELVKLSVVFKENADFTFFVRIKNQRQEDISGQFPDKHVTIDKIMTTSPSMLTDISTNAPSLHLRGRLFAPVFNTLYLYPGTAVRIVDIESQVGSPLLINAALHEILNTKTGHIVNEVGQVRLASPSGNDWKHHIPYFATRDVGGVKIGMSGALHSGMIQEKREGAIRDMAKDLKNVRDKVFRYLRMHLPLPSRYLLLPSHNTILHSRGDGMGIAWSQGGWRVSHPGVLVENMTLVRTLWNSLKYNHSNEGFNDSEVDVGLALHPILPENIERVLRNKRVMMRFFLDYIRTEPKLDVFLSNAPIRDLLGPSATNAQIRRFIELKNEYVKRKIIPLILFPHDSVLGSRDKYYRDLVTEVLAKFFGGNELNRFGVSCMQLSLDNNFFCGESRFNLSTREMSYIRFLRQKAHGSVPLSKREIDIAVDVFSINFGTAGFARCEFDILGYIAKMNRQSFRDVAIVGHPENLESPSSSGNAGSRVGMMLIEEDEYALAKIKKKWEQSGKISLFQRYTSDFTPSVLLIVPTYFKFKHGQVLPFIVEAVDVEDVTSRVLSITELRYDDYFLRSIEIPDPSLRVRKSGLNHPISGNTLGSDSAMVSYLTGISGVAPGVSVMKNGERLGIPSDARITSIPTTISEMGGRGGDLFYYGSNRFAVFGVFGVKSLFLDPVFAANGVDLYTLGVYRATFGLPSVATVHEHINNLPVYTVKVLEPWENEVSIVGGKALFIDSGVYLLLSKYGGESGDIDTQYHVRGRVDIKRGGSLIFKPGVMGNIYGRVFIQEELFVRPEEFTVIPDTPTVTLRGDVYIQVSSDIDFRNVRSLQNRDFATFFNVFSESDVSSSSMRAVSSAAKKVLFIGGNSSGEEAVMYYELGANRTKVALPFPLLKSRVSLIGGGIVNNGDVQIRITGGILNFFASNRVTDDVAMGQPLAHFVVGDLGCSAGQMLLGTGVLVTFQKSLDMSNSSCSLVFELAQNGNIGIAEFAHGRSFFIRTLRDIRFTKPLNGFDMRDFRRKLERVGGYYLIRGRVKRFVNNVTKDEEEIFCERQDNGMCLHLIPKKGVILVSKNSTKRFSFEDQQLASNRKTYYVDPNERVEYVKNSDVLSYNFVFNLNLGEVRSIGQIASSAEVSADVDENNRLPVDLRNIFFNMLGDTTVSNVVDFVQQSHEGKVSLIGGSIVLKSNDDTDVLKHRYLRQFDGRLQLLVVPREDSEDLDILLTIADPVPSAIIGRAATTAKSDSQEDPVSSAIIGRILSGERARVRGLLAVDLLGSGRSGDYNVGDSVVPQFPSGSIFADVAGADKSLTVKHKEALLIQSDLVFSSLVDMGFDISSSVYSKKLYSRDPDIPCYIGLGFTADVKKSDIIAYASLKLQNDAVGKDSTDFTFDVLKDMSKMRKHLPDSDAKQVLCGTKNVTLFDEFNFVVSQRLSPGITVNSDNRFKFTSLFRSDTRVLMGWRNSSLSIAGTYKVRVALQDMDNTTTAVNLLQYKEALIKYDFSRLVSGSFGGMLGISSLIGFNDIKGEKKLRVIQNTTFNSASVFISADFRGYVFGDLLLGSNFKYLMSSLRFIDSSNRNSVGNWNVLGIMSHSTYFNWSMPNHSVGVYGRFNLSKPFTILKSNSFANIDDFDSLNENVIISNIVFRATYNTTSTVRVAFGMQVFTKFNICDGNRVLNCRVVRSSSVLFNLSFFYNR